MKTSFNWIKNLVEGIDDVTPQQYADAMTMSGSKVEFYERLDANLERIVIGQIDRIEKHPDADKLVVCQVNTGSEKIQIVTGATNVCEGDRVPVVLDGGRVAGDHNGNVPEGGIKIKKGKLRGVESNGMLCSIGELGSNCDMFPDAAEDGIYILSEDAPIGESAIEYLGLDDCVVEYEITSNRVDCFAVLGIAREAAATFGKSFHPPVVEPVGNKENVNDYISVEVRNPALCPRYTARVVKNIKIAPSPAWMQKRLRAQGIRPINNIVDITNYVMEEYGQPMHAYDLDTIEDRKIVVRNANEGERFVTLDGQERILDSDMLMICDGKKPVGIGGIMGGENSMITDSVSTMLFEAACFDGTSIRLSSKKLGMRTEASGIFEKGLDANNAILAMDRACQLVEEMGAGEVVGGVVDIYPLKKEPVILPFEPEKYNHILGTDITENEMLSYFERLEIGYDEERRELHIPSFRQDLLSYADIAEEVARFFGYDKIPTTLPMGAATAGKLSKELVLEEKVRNIALYCGFSQSMTYSFESPKVFDKLLLDEDDPMRKAIVISNPLGEDFSIMRTSVLNGILTSLALNYSRRNQNVALFELGRIYIPDALPLEELPDERMQLILGFYGEGDFYSMKGTVEEILDGLGLGEKRSYDIEKKYPFLHPGRQASIVYRGKIIGFIGEVHPLVCKNYYIKDRVYLANLDLPTLLPLMDSNKKYEMIPKYPAATRDLSLMVPKKVTAAQLEAVFESKGGVLLESTTLFDLYEGAQVVSGYKSMAYSLVFRARNRNLSDEDVSEAITRILKGLDALGVHLRQ